MIPVKICGLTRLEDAVYASRLGAWALGFVFYTKSPRYVAPKLVGEFQSKLPKSIRKVGVFVNPTYLDIEKAVEESGIDTIQLHGDESLDFIEEMAGLSVSIIKALRPKHRDELGLLEQYQNSGSIEICLVDSYSDKVYGGSGHEANWRLADELAKNRPIILSGGLNPKNLTLALQNVSAFGVDVSSGVEEAPGIKSQDKLEMFFSILREASASVPNKERML